MRITKNIIHKTSGFCGIRGLKIKHIVIDIITLTIIGFFLFLLHNELNFNVFSLILFISFIGVVFGTILAMNDIPIINSFLKPNDKRYYVKTEVIVNEKNKNSKNKNAQKHTKHDTL